MLSPGLLTKFRDATAAAYEAQKDSRILWRLAELNRALGDLKAAGEAFATYADLHPAEPMARTLSSLMLGTGTSPVADVDGVVPFVLVRDLAPESELVKIRKAIEERRDRFATATVGHNEKQRVDVNARAAVYIRADDQFREMTRDFFWAKIRERQVIEKMGLPQLSETRDEVEAIAYASGGKYAVHRDNAPSVDNGRILTVVWFIHDVPKGFSGGDLLLHDEPPIGQGFTRIVPERNSAIFFPSDCLHEVTPVESTVDDVLASRMVLNGWFHKAEA
jgi:Rps23 Pro-64 3,4-dihydroxylase Tpa1-like proline 4-hydroxylase